MPLNYPNITQNNYSWGSALVYIAASGATPQTDIGALGEGPVGFEFSNEIRDIEQGVPLLKDYSFATRQGLKINFEGIEWNQDLIHRAVGSGNTYSSGTLQTWAWGGDPLVETVAIKVTHYMAKAGQTLTKHVWKARPSGKMALSYTRDQEHKFAHEYEAVRSATNWAGSNLAYDEQLFAMYRQLS